MPVNFWQKLKETGRPILALAPMAGFTDSAFRQIAKRYGADVLYSEMASATALFYNKRHPGRRKKEGIENSTLDLLKSNRRKEKYYVVQLFGSNPEHFAAAARLVEKEIKPDGLDINFGCPANKVMKQDAGAGLMQNLENSRAVIKAVLNNTKLPVSIKIRTKSKEVTAQEFLQNIFDLPVTALMIHGRTLSQGLAGAPDWRAVKETRKYFKGIILANGAITDLESARRVLQETKADGLGLARGVLGRPWLFKEIKTGKRINLKPKQIFKILIDYAAAVQKAKGKRGIIDLRKHLVWYVAGLPGAAKIREQLVRVNSLKEIKDILERY